MSTSARGTPRFRSPGEWVVTAALVLLASPVAVALPDAPCCSGSACCGFGGGFGIPCTLTYGASGTVSDAETGEPIAGARVTVNQGISGLSAPDGSFSVGASLPETCNLDYFVEVAVRKDGYETFRDGLYTSVPLRHVDARLAPIPIPSPTPVRTPTPDPCGLPTAPQCPIGEEPECFSGGQCVGCRCRPCLPCPPGFHFTDQPNRCVCTHGFHRVSGTVAEIPPCDGRVAGVTVRFQGLGETTETSSEPGSAGTFEFPRVPPGDHTLTVEPRCNPFGCWDPLVVHVVDEDVSVEVCPREGSAVRLNVGRVVGAPGDVIAFEVNLDSGARPVASLSHTVSFEADAPIPATTEGFPDCSLNPALDADAGFRFEPAGCTPGADCERVRVEVQSIAGALPDGSLYSCRVEIPAGPSDRCHYPLPCGDLILADPADAPLEGTCEDGSLSSALPVAEPDFHFEVSPENPAVGDGVELRVTVRGAGGRPQYRLTGAEPIFAGDTSTRYVSNFGTVVYDLQAAQSGTASLVMSVTYETELGCPGNLFYGYVSGHSDPFVVQVGESASFSPTPTPSCPTPTPIQCHPAGFTQQCELAFGNGGSCPDATCRCVQCPPCAEGEAYDGAINSCRCVSDTAVRPGGGCAGDCDDDGRVMVDELIAGISIALGAGDLNTCEAADSDGDGTVTVGDLMRGVGRALQGCPGRVER